MGTRASGSAGSNGRWSRSAWAVTSRAPEKRSLPGGTRIGTNPLPGASAQVVDESSLGQPRDQARSGRASARPRGDSPSHPHPGGHREAWPNRHQPLGPETPARGDGHLPPRLLAGIGRSSRSLDHPSTGIRRQTTGSLGQGGLESQQFMALTPVHAHPQPTSGNRQRRADRGVPGLVPTRKRQQQWVSSGPCSSSSRDSNGCSASGCSR